MRWRCRLVRFFHSHRRCLYLHPPRALSGPRVTGLCSLDLCPICRMHRRIADTVQARGRLAQKEEAVTHALSQFVVPACLYPAQSRGWSGFMVQTLGPIPIPSVRFVLSDYPSGLVRVHHANAGGEPDRGRASNRVYIPIRGAKQLMVTPITSRRLPSYFSVELLTLSYFSPSP